MAVRTAIELIALLILIGLRVHDKNRIQRQYGILNQRIQNLGASLNEFVKECEQTFSEFSLRMGRAEPAEKEGKLQHRSGKQNDVCTRPRSLEVAVRPKSKVEPSPLNSSSQEGGKARWPADTILQLAAEGKGSREIAARLGVTQGEIELVLNLNATIVNARRTEHAVEATL